jgi:glycerophosphoryl diester phosphodiesterase
MSIRGREGGQQSAEGPPWVLGLRGSPREAPENTLASLRRGLELGLDGWSVDVRACGGGELVLCADATLDRTSDGHGRLAEHAPRELGAVDAGAWFSPRFSGEKLAFLAEALALRGRAGVGAPQVVLVLREPEVLASLAATLEEHARRRTVRVLSDHRSACAEARELGLDALYLARRLSDDVRRFASEERLTAVAARWREWDSPLGRAEWPCERFVVDIESPDELLAAVRAGVNAIVTTEPRRALNVRRLVKLAPDDRGPYPLRASELLVEPQHTLGGEGEWCGSWTPEVTVRNPFPFAVAVELRFEVRRGAFECRGLPPRFELAAGADLRVPLALAGGSWSPGGDPLVWARFFDAASGAEPILELDAPLRRLRVVHARTDALRLALLRESPGDPPASVTLRRRHGDLLVSLESAGDLADARVVVHLDGEYHIGTRGLRLPLPAGFSGRPSGVPFSVGIEGLRNTRRGVRTVVRRWAGGLPDTLAGGEPGLLRTSEA